MAEPPDPAAAAGVAAAAAPAVQAGNANGVCLACQLTQAENWENAVPLQQHPRVVQEDAKLCKPCITSLNKMHDHHFSEGRQYCGLCGVDRDEEAAGWFDCFNAGCSQPSFCRDCKDSGVVRGNVSFGNKRTCRSCVILEAREMVEQDEATEEDDDDDDEAVEQTKHWVQCDRCNKVSKQNRWRQH